MHTPSASARHIFLFFFALLAVVSQRMVRAADTTAPTIANATITPTGTYGAAGSDLPTITVSATVTDTGAGASGIASVYAFVLINGSSTGQPFHLSNGGGGNVYTGTISLGSNYGGNTGTASRVFTVQFAASDGAGNTATAEAKGSVIQRNDDAPPTVTNAAITPTGTYGALSTDLPDITITATVTDAGSSATGVNTVSAFISFNDGTIVTSSLLLSSNGGHVYTGTFAPSTSFGSN